MSPQVPHVTETVYRHVIVPVSRHYSATGSYGITENGASAGMKLSSGRCR